MAKKAARQASPSFHEVVFKGSPKAVRGLLVGLALGADAPGQIWYHCDEDIAPADCPEGMRRTAERLHLLPVSEVRVVVTGPLAKRLRSLRSAIADSGVCELKSIKRIKQARVEVSYHTYARRYDEEVRVLLKGLPRGVRLTDVRREVTTDAKAKGVEAYPAVHDYEASGSGTLVGRLDTILDLRDRLDVHPLIDCGEVELELA